MNSGGGWSSGAVRRSATSIGGQARIYSEYLAVDHRLDLPNMSMLSMVVYACVCH